MNVWLLVNALQAGIFVAAVLFGRIVLRLSFVTAAIAAAFVMPAPLFQIAGGAGSWVFASDIVAVFFLLTAVVGALTPEQQIIRQRNRKLLLVALVLLLLPAFSTFVGIALNPQPRAWQFVALQVTRCIGYFFVFRHYVIRGDKLRIDRILQLQCLVFAVISLLGLSQKYLGIDLDLWNQATGAWNRESSWGYGGGFMGMYRGEVGAWAIMILGVLPLVMANRWGWNLIMPIVVVLVIGGVLTVGSRQGLFIGTVAFALGLFAAIRTLPQGLRAAAILKSSLACAALLAVSLYSWGAVSEGRMGTFTVQRFGEFMDPAALIQGAWNRDARYDLAYENIINHPVILVIGTGYGVEQIAATSGGYVHRYIDSELFYTWQLGGTTLLLVYIAFLAAVRLGLRRSHWPLDQSGATAAGAGLVVLYASMMLMWGHFSLLTAFSHHATVAYWQWATLGLALSACAQNQSAIPNALQPDVSDWR